MSKQKLCDCPPSNVYQIQCSLSEPKASSEEWQQRKALPSATVSWFFCTLVMLEINSVHFLSSLYDSHTMRDKKKLASNLLVWPGGHVLFVFFPDSVPVISELYLSCLLHHQVRQCPVWTDGGWWGGGVHIFRCKHLLAWKRSKCSRCPKWCSILQPSLSV